MKSLIETLVNGKHSLVIESMTGEIFMFDGRGVKDLYRLYVDSARVLKNARVADKVIGMGAAALMIEGGIKEYHAQVVSRQALELFNRYGIDGTHDVLTEQIINRAGTGRCPLETLVCHLSDTTAMLPLIHQFGDKNGK